ncbi:DNA methyltransferase [Planctomycetota bacterium]
MSDECGIPLFCLYGWKGETKHFWSGPKNESTLWYVRRDRIDLYHHPTQKALELTERSIRNSSKRGDIVFDPSLCSGTTLIAAAMLGRRCFGMEIELKYCDCIVYCYIALNLSLIRCPLLAFHFQRYQIQLFHRLLK